MAKPTDSDETTEKAEDMKSAKAQPPASESASAADRKKFLAAVFVLALIGPSIYLLAAAPASGPKTRVYYIAADEVAWDFAPLGRNGVTGQPFDGAANVFVGNAPDRIGHIYLKAVYREYTDATFSVRKLPLGDGETLGVLGPVIRAEVGDTIQVFFKNNARYNFSIHPHGVFYGKDSEGAPYDDGTSGADKADDSVPTNGTHTYTWKVPERAGPGPSDGSTIVWTYHSHVDEAGDVNAGLLGPIVVAKRGGLGADGRPVGIDRELFGYFTVHDENRSPYLFDNIGRYVQDQAAVELQMALAGGEEGGGFAESNLMHGINGFVFGNGPGYTMHVGEHVRWYMIAAGTEFDIHTPHWHGETLTYMGMRTDMVELLPMSMKVLDMVPDDPGTWLFHCHVNDHLDSGMLTTFEVLP